MEKEQGNGSKGGKAEKEERMGRKRMEIGKNKDGDDEICDFYRALKN